MSAASKTIARIINKLLLKNPGWVSEVKGDSVFLNDKYKITVEEIDDKRNLTSKST